MAPSDPSVQPASATDMDGLKSEKRHKKDKSDRKRARDGDDGDAPRRHKKHRKQGSDEANDETGDTSPNAQLALEIRDVERKENKRKKSKQSRRSEAVPIDEAHNPVDVAPGMTKDSTALRTAGRISVAEEHPSTGFMEEHTKSKKKSRKNMHGQDIIEAAANPSDLELRHTGSLEDRIELKKKKKKRKNADGAQNIAMEASRGSSTGKAEKRKDKSRQRDKDLVAPPADVDFMDIDVPKSHLQPVNAPAKPSFPFFAQKVYLYLPLYPAGFATPISSIAKQHLEPLVNHYSPMLRGVVLGYSNVSIAHRPTTRGSPQADDTPAILESIDEYAVGFGWLTVDVSW